MPTDEQASAARLTAIAEKLTRALMDAWLNHPGTKAGEWGKPSDVYFSVEKAVDALAPVVRAHVETLQQQVKDSEAREDDIGRWLATAKQEQARLEAEYSAAESGLAEWQERAKIIEQERDGALRAAKREFEAKRQAEQQREAALAALQARQAKLLAEHGGNCGEHESLTYHYDMEVAAALHEIGLAIAALHPDTGRKDCDHKFIDSPHCLKCGWIPPARRTETVLKGGR